MDMTARFAVCEKFPSQRAAIDALIARYKLASDPSSEFDIQEIRPNAGELLRRQVEENFGVVPLDAVWSRSWVLSYSYSLNGYVHRWVRDGGEVLFTIREVQ